MPQSCSTAPRERRILLAVTVSVTARSFLRGQMRHLVEAGWSVSLVCSPSEDLAELAAAESITVAPVPMARSISLWADLRSLATLYRLLRRLRPDVSNVGTPKAGLLVGLAAALTRVPCRIYTMRGLPLQTTSGFRRRVLMTTEKLAIRCAHQVVCVSPSLRDQVVQLGLAQAGRVTVIGAGSSNGVDAARFSPTPERQADADNLRAAAGIPPAATVVGFMGRLTRDKGIGELMTAWRTVSDNDPDAWLLLIGDEEAADPVSPVTRTDIATLPRVARVAWLAEAAIGYLAMDVLVLPTYREGFPNVVLEAAAAGRPTVTTDATGAVDSVVPGVTGLIVPVGDATALATALDTLVADPDLARQLGSNAHARVVELFRPETVWSGLDDVYDQVRRDRQGAMTT